MELMVDPRLAANVDGDAGRGAPAPVGRVEAGGMVSALGDVPQAGAVSCVEAGGSVPVLGDAPRAAAVSRVEAGGMVPAPGDAPQALSNLITGEGPHRRTSTTLLVIADYDTISRVWAEVLMRDKSRDCW